MNAEDKREIAELLQQQTDVMVKSFQHHVSIIDQSFQQHIGIMAESFQHKLDIVVEGHMLLNDKIDGIEGRMDRLESKVDVLAVDLLAHRADTEAHHGVYRVKEQ